MTHVYLVTCEHGGNEVPAAYRDCFASRQAEIWRSGHRGYDPGALMVAERLAAHLGCELIASTTTRLLVDLNRSLDNPALWSRFSRSLDSRRRADCLAEHYHPYRNRVIDFVRGWNSRGASVTHFSVHSFTPRLAGISRKLDIGLLLDPRSETENRLCDRWRQSLESQGSWRVALNQPYAGTDDGLTTTLRQLWNDNFISADENLATLTGGLGVYGGIEIELTNRLAGWRPERRERLIGCCLETLPRERFGCDLSS